MKESNARHTVLNYASCRNKVVLDPLQIDYLVNSSSYDAVAPYVASDSQAPHIPNRAHLVSDDLVTRYAAPT